MAVLELLYSPDPSCTPRLLLVDFIEIISFPLSNSSSFAWKEVQIVAPLTNGLAYMSLTTLGNAISTAAASVLFFGTLIWTASIVLAAIWCGYSFSNRQFKALWPLRFLRFGARATATGFFIPLLYVPNARGLQLCTTIAIAICNFGDRESVRRTSACEVLQFAVAQPCSSCLAESSTIR